MTEHVTDGETPPTQAVDAEIIPLPVHGGVVLTGKYYTPEGTLEPGTTEIWSELDATLSDDEVASIVENLNSGKLIFGTDNVDRPLILTEWILRQAHTTIDWRPLKQRRVAYAAAMADLERRRLTTPNAKLSAKQKMITPLTHYEQSQLKMGESVWDEIRAAVAEIEEIKATLDTPKETGDKEDITLLDVLDGYENVMRPKIAHTNTIRIYNKLYDKLHASDGKRPSPDLIIAGRVLLMFMKGRLGPTDDQS